MSRLVSRFGKTGALFLACALTYSLSEKLKIKETKDFNFNLKKYHLMKANKLLLSCKISFSI
jgi:hypothetical protein